MTVLIVCLAKIKRLTDNLVFVLLYVFPGIREVQSLLEKFTVFVLLGHVQYPPTTKIHSIRSKSIRSKSTRFKIHPIKIHPSQNPFDQNPPDSKFTRSKSALEK